VKQKRIPIYPLVALFIFSFVIRIIFLLIIIPGEPVSDPSRYIRRAELILEKGTYADSTGSITAYEPPFTAVFISPIVATGNRRLIGVYNALFNSISIILAYLLFIRGNAGKKQAIYSAIVLSVMPSWLFYNGFVNAEIPFVLFGLSSLLLLDIDGRFWRSLLSGIFTGIAILTKGLGIFILPLGFFLLWREGMEIKRIFKIGIIAFCGALLVISPWIARNLTKMDFAGISTNTGPNLYIGNSEIANGSWVPYTETLPPETQEIERSRFYSKKALEWVASNPGKFLTLLPKKFFWLWTPEYEWVIWHNPSNIDFAWKIAIAGQVLWWTILLISIFSIVKRRVIDKDPIFDLSIITVFGISAFYLIFFGAGRFHYPVCWAIAYLAVYPNKELQAD